MKQKLQTALAAAFERAWLSTDNKDAIRQAVRVLERSEKKPRRPAVKRKGKK